MYVTAALAKMLQKNLRERKCCRVKFIDVRALQTGKPLDDLRCTDFICCGEWRQGEEEKGPLARGAHPPPQYKEEDEEREVEGAEAHAVLDCDQKQLTSLPSSGKRITNLPCDGELLLPHDLLLFAVLLPCLPLPDVFRARAVCRAWHQALSSSRFLCLSIHSPDFAHPRLILQTSTPIYSSCLAVFDPCLTPGRWYSTPIPLPPFRLVAAAGGLLCFSIDSPSRCWERGLLVGNPLTQQWKELPPIPLDMGAGGFPFCAMCADPLLGYYKVLIMHHSGCKIASYTYESSTARWEGHKCEHPPHKRSDFFSTRGHGVSPPGILHQLNSDGRLLMSYNVAANSARLLDIPVFPSCMDVGQCSLLKAPYSRFPALACCGERFYMVARVEANAPMAGGRLPFVLHGPVGIWELQLSSGTRAAWKGPVSMAPQDLLEHAIAGSDGTDFHVTTDGLSTIYLILSGGATILAYEVLSRMWCTLPGCPAAHLLYIGGHAYYEPLLWPGPI